MRRERANSPPKWSIMHQASRYSLLSYSLTDHLQCSLLEKCNRIHKTAPATVVVADIIYLVLIIQAKNSEDAAILC